MGNNKKSPPERKKRSENSVGEIAKQTSKGFETVILWLLAPLETVATLITVFAAHKLVSSIVLAVLLGFTIMIFAKNRVQDRLLLSILFFMYLVIAFGTVLVVNAAVTIAIPAVDNLQNGMEEQKQEARSQDTGEHEQEEQHLERLYKEQIADDKTENKTSQAGMNALTEAVRPFSMVETEADLKVLSEHVLEASYKYAPMSNSAVKMVITVYQAEPEETETEEDLEFTRLTKVCADMLERYQKNPTLDNARALGIAAQDCLDYIEKTRESALVTHILNVGICNRANLLIYSEIACGAFLDMRAMVDGTEDTESDKKAVYNLAQVFERLGMPYWNEWFEKEDRIVYSGIAVVFFRTYINHIFEGKTKKQWISPSYCFAAEYMAALLIRLDTEISPESSFFLEEAERYYTYIEDYPQWDQPHRKRIKKYKEDVGERLKVKSGL